LLAIAPANAAASEADHGWHLSQLAAHIFAVLALEFSLLAPLLRSPA